MFRRKLPLNPYSFAIILIVLFLLAISQSFVENDSNTDDIKATIVEDTNDTVTVEFDNQ